MRNLIVLLYVSSIVSMDLPIMPQAERYEWIGNSYPSAHETKIEYGLYKKTGPKQTVALVGHLKLSFPFERPREALIERLITYPAFSERHTQYLLRFACWLASEKGCESAGLYADGDIPQEKEDIFLEEGFNKQVPWVKNNILVCSISGILCFFYEKHLLK